MPKAADNKEKKEKPSVAKKIPVNKKPPQQKKKKAVVKPRKKPVAKKAAVVSKPRPRKYLTPVGGNTQNWKFLSLDWRTGQATCDGIHMTIDQAKQHGIIEGNGQTCKQGQIVVNFL